MAIVEIIKDIVIPLLQVVSIPVVAIASSAKIKKLVKKNNELKEQIRLIKEIPLTLKNYIYYDKNNNPFCPVCFGSSPSLYIPLTKIDPACGYTHRCKKCSSDFNI